VENKIDTMHGMGYGCGVANVTQIKLKFWRLVGLTHIVLFLLVAAENTNFGNLGVEKATHDGVAKRASTTRYKESFVRKHSPYVIRFVIAISEAKMLLS
jgi:hypothetical protein